MKCSCGHEFEPETRYRHKVMCGDSVNQDDVLKLIGGGGKVDCIFTSPPYAVGIDYGATYEDNIESLRSMLPILSTLWQKILHPGGFAVINFGDIVSGSRVIDIDEPCEYPMALEYWNIFREAGYTLWSRRIWCKPVARVAAPWCASSNRSATNWEHIWTWKTKGKPIVGRVGQPMDSQSGWIDTSKLEGVDIGKEIHGAGMPVSIAAWMINVHSNKGAIIHEPFLGTGTTVVAAEQLGRHCYGCDISPGYVAITLERLSGLGLIPELIKDKK